MASPRYNQISLEETNWYHVVSRCVRRAYLCGEDYNSGQSYEHRRDWVANRIKYLASIFTIDVAAYAIMHNHYHIVVRVDNERVWELSTEEVVNRWTSLYKGPVLIQRYMSALREEMSAAEIRQVEILANDYRDRLCDLSWFMKNLNHYIACRANKEDQVKGHFWESRFKCQALLDEQAVLAAMAYTDLNPIRAGIAESLEESEYASVRQRVDELKGVAAVAPDACRKISNKLNDDGSIDRPGLSAPLLPFDPIQACQASIPFAFADYLELLETASRVVYPGKRGVVSDATPRLLQRYNIGLSAFIKHSNQFIECFGNHVGDPKLLSELAVKRNARYLRGVGKSRSLFGGVSEAA